MIILAIVGTMVLVLIASVTIYFNNKSIEDEQPVVEPTAEILVVEPIVIKKTTEPKTTVVKTSAKPKKNAKVSRNS